MRLPFPCSPNTTSSEHFNIVLLANIFCPQSHKCWQSWTAEEEELTGTGEKPTFKPSSSRQEPISSQGQPTTTQTHLQPITRTHTLTQVKRGILKDRQTFMTSRVVTQRLIIPTKDCVMLNYFVGLRSRLHSAFVYLKTNPIVLEMSKNFKMCACRCYNHTLHMCIASRKLDN